MTMEWKNPPTEIISAIKENTDDFSVTNSKFFASILQSIETKDGLILRTTTINC